MLSYNKGLKYNFYNGKTTGLSAITPKWSTLKAAEYKIIESQALLENTFSYLFWQVAELVPAKTCQHHHSANIVVCNRIPLAGRSCSPAAGAALIQLVPVEMLMYK
jgi:hypothetical protein